MLIHLPSEHTSSILQLADFSPEAVSALHLKALRGEATQLSALLREPPTLRALTGMLGQLPPLSALGLLALPPFGAGVIGSSIQGSGNEAALWNAALGQWLTYTYTPNTRLEASLPDQLLAFYTPALLPMLPGSLALAMRSSATGPNLNRMALAATPLVWAIMTRQSHVGAAVLNGGIRALQVIRAARETQRLTGKQNTVNTLHGTAGQGLCLQRDLDAGLRASEAQWRWHTASAVATTYATSKDQPHDWDTLIHAATSALAAIPDEEHWKLTPVDIQTLHEHLPEVPADPHPALDEEFNRLLQGESRTNIHKKVERDGGLTRLLELLWIHQNDPRLHHPSIWRSLGGSVNTKGEKNVFTGEYAFNPCATDIWAQLLTLFRERGAAFNQTEVLQHLTGLSATTQQWHAAVRAAWAEVDAPQLPARFQAGTVSLKRLNPTKKGA